MSHMGLLFLTACGDQLLDNGLLLCMAKGTVDNPFLIRQNGFAKQQNRNLNPH